MDLLRKLCNVHAPSGHEEKMKTFLLQYIEEKSPGWKSKPKVIAGKEFQNCILLVFGKPRTAVFAHMDSIGYMVRYGKQLIPIGGPDSKSGYILEGEDQSGAVTCTLSISAEGKLEYDSSKEIERGTALTFQADFREGREFIQCAYLDNRLGVWNALKVAETLENGILAFSCWEEHGGGSVPYLCKYIYEKYQVKQALISDITWVTEGVLPGKGAAISIRDRSIPNRSFVNKIIALVRSSGIVHQLEVEEYGGSDGKELQSSPYPFDWCFIGAPEQYVHSPDEKVHKKDIESMVEIYQYLMKAL
jgi:putative aminopeptidase FrvX